MIDTPHFKSSEFMCKCGCGENETSQHLVNQLEYARIVSNIPYHINSATRCDEHNDFVGGHPNSSHRFNKLTNKQSTAVDINADTEQERFLIIYGLLKAGFVRIGIGKTFIHADVDKEKTQNKIWLY